MALKIFFTYLLSPFNFFFLRMAEFQKINFHTLLLTQQDLYFTILHLRFSSRFSSFQLVDIFSYEVPVKNVLGLGSSILVYNFHGLQHQDRLLVFVVKTFSRNSNFFLKSIVEVFPNAWWLEREVSELNSVFFEGKKDVRNLMLQYGDTSHPFRKSYPSIGTREMFYDGSNDVIVQNLVTTQV